MGTRRFAPGLRVADHPRRLSISAFDPVLDGTSHTVQLEVLPLSARSRRSSSEAERGSCTGRLPMSTYCRHARLTKHFRALPVVECGTVGSRAFGHRTATGTGRGGRAGNHTEQPRGRRCNRETVPKSIDVAGRRRHPVHCEVPEARLVEDNAHRHEAHCGASAELEEPVARRTEHLQTREVHGEADAGADIGRRWRRRRCVRKASAPCPRTTYDLAAVTPAGRRRRARRGGRRRAVAAAQTP